MTAYTWSATTSGSWGTAADWGPNGLPTNLDSVSINVANVTVSVGSGVTAAAYTLSTSGAGLLIDGGTLSITQQATFNGAFTETSGVFNAGGSGAIFNRAMTLGSGAVIALRTGQLAIDAGGTLSGTLSGSGVLDIQGGPLYIDAGFVCQLSSIVIGQGAQVGFETNYAYTHNLTSIDGVLDLFGHTMTLGGTDVFSGVVGDGLITVNGTLSLGTPIYGTTLDNGLTLNVANTAVQTNQLALGVTDSGAKLVVTAAGHYAINGDWGITDPSSTATITNKGVFAKTGGGKISQVDASMVSTGTLQVGIGELLLNGLVNTVQGSVSGGGTLGIAGGQTVLAPHLALGVAAVEQQSGRLILNTAQAYAGQWSMSGGVLNLNARAAVLNLSGTSSFDGGVVTGYGGGLVIGGAAEFSNVTLGGPIRIAVNGGSVNQTGNITFGASSNTTIAIAAGSSWSIEGDSSISGFYGQIVNAGKFADPNGSGNAVVQSQLFNTGSVIANSTLTLAGNGNALGGQLLGSGLIDVTGYSVLEAGLAIKVAALDVDGPVTLAGNIGDAGLFTQNSGVLDMGGANTLSLTGSVSLDVGTLTDGGVLRSAGATTVAAYTLTGGAELLIAGQAVQSRALALDGVSGGGTLMIATTGTYTILDDLSITGPTGAVIVGGQLIEAGTGSTTIEGSLGLLAGGVLAANDQSTALYGGGTLAGQIAGSGRVDLGAGTFTLAAGVALQSAGLDVNGAANVALQASTTYAGDFTSGNAIFALGGDTLTLASTALLGDGGTLSGPGELLASSTTTLGSLNVYGNATLAVSGSALQLGYLTVGDPTGAASTASLVIAKGGTDTLGAGDAIVGNGTLQVSGSLVAGGNGLSVITTGVVDAGVIAANLGTLQLTGAVSGGGSFSIGSAGFLDFSNTSTITSATDINFAGAGRLQIDSFLQSFQATIENFAVNDAIQFANLTAGSLTGTYANAAHTQLLVTDGQNSLTVTFASAQNLASLSFGAGVGGIATLTHH